MLLTFKIPVPKSNPRLGLCNEIPLVPQWGDLAPIPKPRVFCVCFGMDARSTACWKKRRTTAFVFTQQKCKAAPGSHACWAFCLPHPRKPYRTQGGNKKQCVFPLSPTQTFTVKIGGFKSVCVASVGRAIALPVPLITHVSLYDCGQRTRMSRPEVRFLASIRQLAPNRYFPAVRNGIPRRQDSSRSP